MSSFYDILNDGTYYTHPVTGEFLTGASFPRIELNPCELEIFKKCGGFLNSVLDEDKERVAHNILIIMDRYRTQSKFNSLYEIDEVKKKNEVTNKVKGDLRKAKAFRETLKSFDEKHKYRPQERIKEHRVKLKELKGNLEPFEISDFEDKEIEVLERYENLKYLGAAEKPYYKMVDLIDEYINDLETKTFKMANKHRYIDYYAKPTRKELNDYLCTVCRELNLKNCINNAKKLVVELNKNC